MYIDRKLDIILEDGRFNKIRNLFKRREESNTTKPEPKAGKGFFGASNRRGFLKKAGKAATSSILPLKHLGLNPVTIKAVTDTLSGNISSGPIIAQIESHWHPRPAGMPMIDNGLARIQKLWHQITRLTENPIDMLCGYGFKSEVSPNLVASIIQQIAKNDNHNIKIGDEHFEINDALTKQNNVITNLVSEIKAIKQSWSEEGKKTHSKYYNLKLKQAEDRLERAKELFQTAKYDFYLTSKGGTRIHITDLPEEISCKVSGPNITRCGKDFSKAVLVWWHRMSDPYTISPAAAEYLDKIGAKPKQFDTWEEYAEAARKSEENTLTRQKEMEKLNEPDGDEPEETKHSPDSMETMRGTSLQYPYNENLNKKLDKALGL
jgi:hypothetical protein